MKKPHRALSGLAVAGASLLFTLSGTSASAEPVTITYASWHLAEQVWGRSLKEAIGEFEKENPDIKVKLQPVSLGQRDVTLTTAIRAGRGPDVFQLDSNPIRQYISEGWVKDLTPFMAKEGGATAYMQDFYPTIREPVEKDGKVYGIPKNIAAMVLTYNKKKLQEAGYDHAPKTWDEFRAVSKKLTKASKEGGVVDQWGTTLVLAPAGFDSRFSVILRGFGGDFLTPDYKHSALKSPQALAAVKYVLDLIQTDKSMPPGVAQVDANGARQLMSQGKVSMIFETMWSVPIIGDMNPQFDVQHTLGMAPVPQNSGADPSKPRSTLYLDALFMNPHTQHAEASWKLMKFLTDKQRMEKWFVDNNMLSARQSVNDSFQPIKDSQFATVVKAEISHSSFLPLIPQWPEVLEIFRQNLQAAVAKSKTAEQALADANTQIEKVLAR
jgi:multiple sugar transport system substrate-binding protein